MPELAARALVLRLRAVNPLTLESPRCMFKAVDQTYRAPWDNLLKVLSFSLTALCCALAVLFFSHGVQQVWIAAGLIALLFGCTLFLIRGYTITTDAILVHRLLWKTRLPLDQLRSAEFVPNAMRRSVRLFGNGGFLSFTGWYRNKLLGPYRAFVTDRQQTVVLHYADRTVVLSPERPGAFARELVPARAG